MFLYIFTLCLTSFYSSSGAPAPPANNTTEPVSLSALANSCESPFLSTQIKGKLQDCAVTVPPNNEKQFQCMLFYDINRQLCSAVAASRLALTADYTTIINSPQDIGPLCQAATGWTFTDLGDIYKKYVKLVFADVVKCTKVCSADDNVFPNVEANFYCKYFKWGSEILKSQVSAPQLTVSGVAAVPDSAAVNSAVDDVKSTDTKPGVPVPVDLPGSTKDSVKPKEPATSPKVQMSPQNVSEVLPPQTGAEVSTSGKVSSTNKAIVGSQIASSVPEQHSNPETLGDSGKDKTVDNVKENSELSGEQQPEVPQPVVAAPEVGEKEVKANPDIAVNIDEKKQKSETAPKVVPPETKINQNDLGDGDDYANDIDSEDSRGPETQQGGDDDTDAGLPETELKPEFDQTKNSKRIELQVSNDISQREYYRGDDFPEEEDHFFPFFLTAIIMVVLLYVLYHNKSKVSKVIMGLIVEGRQSGRRRNSRGHAYKRLDTLEQAMSASTAAPPSKIIY